MFSIKLLVFLVVFLGFVFMAMAAGSKASAQGPFFPFPGQGASASVVPLPSVSPSPSIVPSPSASPTESPASSGSPGPSSSPSPSASPSTSPTSSVSPEASATPPASSLTPGPSPSTAPVAEAVLNLPPVNAVSTFAQIPAIINERLENYYGTSLIPDRVISYFLYGGIASLLGGIILISPEILSIAIIQDLKEMMFSQKNYEQG